MQQTLTDAQLDSETIIKTSPWTCDDGTTTWNESLLCGFSISKDSSSNNIEGIKMTVCDKEDWPTQETVPVYECQGGNLDYKIELTNASH